MRMATFSNEIIWGCNGGRSILAIAQRSIAKLATDVDWANSSIVYDNLSPDIVKLCYRMIARSAIEIIMLIFLIRLINRRLGVS